MNHFAETRRVWADITRHPQASTREIARRTGLPLDTIQLAIYHLDTLGYICRTPGQSRARQVLVPFAVLEEGAPA